MIQTLLNQVLPGQHGRPVLADAFWSEGQHQRPLVLFVHGFKGFKDWGHFNMMAGRMAQAGFLFVKFNLSHNGGTVEQPIDFPDLEAFANNTFSIELDDIGTAIDWALQHPELSKLIDKDNIALIGHSRGGGLTVLKAGEDQRIKRIVTWGAVHNFEAWTATDSLAEWRESGVRYFPNSRTGQQMPMNFSIYEDFEANRERLDIPAIARQLQVPALIIHGTGDEAVPTSAAEALASWIPGAELKLIPDSGHTFGATHPHNSNELPGDTPEVLQATIDFLAAW